MPETSVRDSQPQRPDPVQFSFANREDIDSNFFFEEILPKEKLSMRVKGVCALICALLFGLSLLITLPYLALLGTVTQADNYYQWLKDMNQEDFERFKIVLFTDYKETWFEDAEWINGPLEGLVIEAAAQGFTKELAGVLLRDNVPPVLAYLTGQSDVPPAFTTQSVAGKWQASLNERLRLSSISTGDRFFEIRISPEETESMLSGVKDTVGTLLTLRYVAMAVTLSLFLASFFLQPFRWKAVRTLSLVAMIVSAALMLVFLVGSMITLGPDAFAAIGQLLAKSVLIWPLVFLLASSVLFLTSRVILTKRRA